MCIVVDVLVLCLSVVCCVVLMSVVVVCGVG